MFNEEKLSLADHDSNLQGNGGLSCGRGELLLYFVPRAEMRSAGSFCKETNFSSM